MSNNKIRTVRQHLLTFPRPALNSISRRLRFTRPDWPTQRNSSRFQSPPRQAPLCLNHISSSRRSPQCRSSHRGSYNSSRLRPLELRTLLQINRTSRVSLIAILELRQNKSNLRNSSNTLNNLRKIMTYRRQTSLSRRYPCIIQQTRIRIISVVLVPFKGLKVASNNRIVIRMML